MANVIPLTTGRLFLELPLSASSEDMLGFTIFCNMVNQRAYSFVGEMIVGDNLRLFFYADKRTLRKIPTWEEYLEFTNTEEIQES